VSRHRSSTSFSRRAALRTLIGFAATGAAGALLAACSNAAAPSAPPTAAAPAPATAPTTAPPAAPKPTTTAAQPASSGGPKGQTLSVGSGVVDANANPLQAQDHTYMYAAFNALTNVDPTDPTPKPELATSWNKVSDTVTEYKLRSGVTFSNGQPLTADDVAFTFNTTLNEKLAISSLLTNIKEVAAVDPMTVRITTDGPDPILESRLALMFIVPRQYYQQVGTDGFGQKPIGSGRFTVDQFVPNQSMVLKANPTAWQGSPASAEVQMTYYSNPSALLSAYQAGQHDIAQLLPTQALNQLQGQGTVQAVSTASSNIITLDTTKPPFSDIRVRQAMTMAMTFQR